MYTYKAELVRVIDGDTVEFEVSLGFNVNIKEKFRFYGIDTPEVYGVKKDSPEYQAGKKASDFVRNALENAKSITIETVKGKGKYGRWLCRVWVDVLPEDMTTATTLNQRLIDENLAEAVSY